MNNIDFINEITYVLAGKMRSLPDNQLSQITIDNAYYKIRKFNRVISLLSKLRGTQYKPIENWLLFKYQFDSNAIESKSRSISDSYRACCLFLKNITIYCSGYNSTIKVLFKESIYNCVVKLLQDLDSLAKGYNFKSTFEECYLKKTKSDNETDVTFYLNYLGTKINKDFIVLNNRTVPEIILNPLKLHLLIKNELKLVIDNAGNLNFDKEKCHFM